MAGVAAVKLTLTVLTPAQAGSVSIFPSRTAWNGSATASFPAGPTVQRSLTESLGADGRLVLRNNLHGAANVIADVTGYYAAGSPMVSGGYQPVVQRRILDTRPTATKVLGPSAEQTATDSGLAGTTAAVLNVTVIAPVRAGSIAAFAGGTSWNGMVSMNYPAATNTQAFLTVPVGAGGTIVFRNMGWAGVPVVADLVGYFSGGTATAAGTFATFPSTRLYDTRTRAGGVLTPRATSVTQTVLGLPASGDPERPLATAGLDAVLARVTVVNPPQAGSLSIYPAQRAFPGTTTMSFAAGASVQSELLINLDGDGAIAIRNNGSSASLVVVVDVLGYVRDRAGSFSTTGALFDQPDQGASALSCPQPDFCVAMEGARPVYYRDAAWTDPVAPITTNLRALSCTSATFCLAMGAQTMQFDGTTWAAVASPPLSAGLKYLSCASPSFCVATSTDRYSVYDGSVWSAVEGLPRINVTGVSCASTIFCLVTGTSGMWSTFDGTIWSTPAELPGEADTAHAPSCSSASNCVAVTARFVWSFDGTTWTGQRPATTDNGLDSAATSCPTDQRCFVLTPAGLAIDVIGHQVRGGFSLGTPWGPPLLSCGSASVCEAMGEDHFHRVNDYRDGSWSLSHHFDWRSGGVTGVSCVGTAFCVAVDVGGAFSRYDGAQWGASARIDQADWLSAVACVSTTECVAGDHSGNVLSFDGTTWSAPASITSRPISQLACPASGHCFAVAGDGSVYSSSGSSWQRTTVPVPTAALSCPTSTFCAAASSDGSVVSWNGSEWSNPVSTGLPDLVSLACSGPNHCLASAGHGVDAASWDGQGWNLVPSSPYLAGQPFACPAQDVCVNPDGDFEWDGSTWSYNTYQASPTTTPEPISCGTSSFCVEISDYESTFLTRA